MGPSDELFRTDGLTRRTLLARGAALAALPALPSFLAACGGGGGDGGGRAEEKTLIFNLDAGISGGLDAAQSFDTTTKQIAFRLSEPLLHFDYERLEPLPGLATDWETAPDGKSIELALRRNVVFHDGSPLDAETVVFSIMRTLDEDHPSYRDGSYPYVSYLGDIAGAEAIDEHTVRIEYSAPDPILPWRLSTEIGYIQSKEAIERYKKDYTNNPVGTGPYRFVEHAPDVRVEIERFDDYWGTAPDIQRVIYTFHTDAAAKIERLLAGEVDLITVPPPDRIAELEETPGINVHRFPDYFYIYWGLYNDLAPLDDIRVRKALNYATDRQAEIDVAAGTLEKQLTPWIEGAFGFTDDVETFDYDPDRARALLQEAGFPEGRGIELQLFPGPDLLGIGTQDAELLQAQLAEVGVNATIRATDPGSYFNRDSGPSFTPEKNGGPYIYWQGWITPLPDPTFALELFYHSRESITANPQGWNLDGFENAEVDRLFDAARVELDLEKRAALYEEAQKIIAKNCTRINGWRHVYVVAAREHVQNIRWNPRQDPDVAEFTLAV